MDDMTRRGALALAASAGAALAATNAAAADDKEKSKTPMTDRERVIACGMTDSAL
jgi:hypothetical protein